MAHWLILSVFIAVAVVTTTLSKPTQSLPTPTKAGVPESTASDQTSTPKSVGSSCAGGLLNTDTSLVRCSVSFQAKRLSRLYKTKANGAVGQNYPDFSTELTAELNSDEQCLLPFLRQMKVYLSLLIKVNDGNTDRNFRGGRRKLRRALGSLVSKLEDVCCEGGSGNATSCCQMDQQLTETSVTGVTYDDNMINYLAITLSNLKSLDQCGNTTRRRRHQRGRRRHRGEKSKSASASDATANKERKKKNKKKNRPSSVAEIADENPAVSTEIVKPTDAQAAELDGGEKGDADHLTRDKPARGRKTKKKNDRNGKKRRRRCRKGRQQRGKESRGRKMCRGKKRGGKKRGGRKQRNKTNPDVAITTTA